MTDTMQTLVVLEPNVLEIQEKPVPEPGPGEVLARVRSVAICGTDAHLIRGDYPGFWPPAFPFTPGHEWAGDLVALGPGTAAPGAPPRGRWGGRRAPASPAPATTPAASARNASKAGTTSARTTASPA